MTVLCYHSVEDEWESPLAVSVADFEAQCAWLAAHRQVRHLEEVVGELDRLGRPHRGVSVITFDDGFAALYDRALPLLERYGLPATVFVVAQTLTPGGQPVDWVRTAPSWPLQTLTLDQVLEMKERGVRFGSHSLRHADLVTLGAEECERDLRESRELLEDLLHCAVPLLAYPEGHHDGRVRLAAGRAGFTLAVTLPDTSEPIGPLSIPRVGIYRGNGLRAFRTKLAAPYLRVRQHVYPAMQRLRRSA